MAYPTDGRNHREAINSEKKMTLNLEFFSNYYQKKIIQINHIGGTKNTTDFRILFEDNSFVDHSLKSKKDIQTGSFDLINISTGALNIDVNFGRTAKIYQNFKGKKNKSAYELLKESISLDLDSLSPRFITDIFKQKVVKKYEKIQLTLEDRKTKKIFPNVKLKYFDLVSEGFELVLRKTNKISMSRKIDLMDKNGNIYKDSGLRLRLHLNNGVTKWINNENSVIVLKFQQDSVNKLI
jgi:hypothetical protein